MSTPMMRFGTAVMVAPSVGSRMGLGIWDIGINIGINGYWELEIGNWKFAGIRARC